MSDDLIRASEDAWRVMTERVRKLEAQVQRYKEALERIAAIEHEFWYVKIAREALNETE